MKLKRIPLSRAKTAWGLIQDVKRAIKAEPKRANMHVFVPGTRAHARAVIARIAAFAKRNEKTLRQVKLPPAGALTRVERGMPTNG